MDMKFEWVQAIPKEQIEVLLDIYRTAKDHRRFMLLLDVKDIPGEDQDFSNHRMHDDIAKEVIEKFGPIIKRRKRVQAC